MAAPPRTSPLLTPLRHADFRRIWSASLITNLGLMINGVGAAWAMTQLSREPGPVALVQSALMLPFMLFAVPAGAISDTYDRRKVGIVALCAAAAASALMLAFAWLDLLTPTLLLALCFLTGSANALFNPVWMSSVGEQVPAADLPNGIALNSASYNMARAFGPAVGGILVAVWGSIAAFAANTGSYLPMLWALLRWRRQPDVPRLPPERIVTAILSGLRYVLHSAPICRSIVRAALFGLAGGSIQSIMPLVARDLLHGGPSTYGVLLGTFGIGAVLGVALLGRVRARLSSEAHAATALLVMAATVITQGVSRWLPLTCLALFIAGIAWLHVTNTLSVSIQGRAPRWVTGRAVAAYQAAIAGGIAVGSWLWGLATAAAGPSWALVASAGALLLVALVGWRFPLSPLPDGLRSDNVSLEDPDVRMALTGRSGPIVVTIERLVDLGEARGFYKAMLDIREIRLRNGAYGWSIARDVSSPERWLERFHCPTWHDYLRQRNRVTEFERDQITDVQGEAVEVRRFLERPFGSVRWRAETPDRGIDLPAGSQGE